MSGAQSECRFRVTVEQAESLHRLLALLRQPAEVASTGEPIHWLEVTTEAQTWTIDDRGRLVGWMIARCPMPPDHPAQRERRSWRRSRAKDYIPQNIQDAARDAGVKSLPLWYIGRRAGPPPPGPALHEVVMQGRRAAGLCDECWSPHKVGEAHTGVGPPP